MIFLPTSDELEEHLGKLSGFQLSIIQDRKDATRITAFHSSPREHRDHHVYRGTDGAIDRIEACPPTGTMADGTPDYRPVIPSRHPDMSYDVAAMLHNAHLLVLENGLADVSLFIDYQSSRHDRSYTSIFSARRPQPGRDPVTLTPREEDHLPRAALLQRLGTEIAKHLDLEISDDGYGGELRASISATEILISYESEDSENNAGFELRSVLNGTSWEHTSTLWCDAPTDSVSRMHAVSHPIEHFETVVEEHLNLSSIVPGDRGVSDLPTIADGELTIPMKPGLMFGRDELTRIR